MYTRCIIELAFVRDTATIPLGGGHGQNSVRDQQLERLYPLIFLPPTLCSLSDISGASPNSILVINGFPTPPLFLRFALSELCRGFRRIQNRVLVPRSLSSPLGFRYIWRRHPWSS